MSKKKMKRAVAHPKAKSKAKTPKNEEEGELYIEPMLLKDLLLADSENKNGQLTLRLVESEWQKTVVANQARMMQLKKAAEEADTTFKEIVTALERKYHIDMKDYAYNAESGRLNYLGVKK